MILKINGRIIKNLINNGQEEIQNQFITMVRTLNGTAIVQKFASIDFQDESLDLVAMTVDDLNYLRGLNGEEVDVDFSGAGQHNIYGKYILQLNDTSQKSYNETQNISIKLVFVKSAIQIQIETIKARFISAGLNWDANKEPVLKTLLKKVIIDNNIPNFMLVPNLSADLTLPSSISLINLGSENVVSTLVNGNVGNTISSGNFIFNSTTQKSITTNYNKQDSLENFTYYIDMVRPYSASALDQVLVSGSSAGTYRIYKSLIAYNQERDFQQSQGTLAIPPTTTDTLLTGIREGNLISLNTNTITGTPFTLTTNYADANLLIGRRSDNTEFLNEEMKCIIHWKKTINLNDLRNLYTNY